MLGEHLELEWCMRGKRCISKVLCVCVGKSRKLLFLSVFLSGILVEALVYYLLIYSLNTFDKIENLISVKV